MIVLQKDWVAGGALRDYFSVGEPKSDVEQAVNFYPDGSPRFMSID